MMAAFKLRAVPININFRYVSRRAGLPLRRRRPGRPGPRRAPSPRRSPRSPHGPARRCGSSCPCPDAPTEGPGRGRPTPTSCAALEALGSVPYADALAGGPPGGLRAALRRRPLRPLHRRHHGHAQGRGVAPRGRLLRPGGGVDAYTQERVTHDRPAGGEGRRLRSGLVTLSTPPLMHGAAQWSTLRFWFEGGTVVLLPAVLDPEAVWAAIESRAVQRRAHHRRRHGPPAHRGPRGTTPARYDLSSLITISSSAAVFSPTVKDRFLEQPPHVMIIDAIGSSESGHNGMVVVEPGSDRDEGRRPVGRPRPRRGRARRRPRAGRRPARAWSGRLARGGNIPLGYHKDEAKTAATFVAAADGQRYALPGDFATVEADGQITLLGRGSVCINSGGEKIFPEEVEASLKAHPDVFDVVVVGVPDERWGPPSPRSSSPVTARPADRSRSSTPTAAPASPATRCPASSPGGPGRALPRRASPTTAGPARAEPTRPDPSSLGGWATASTPCPP